MQNEQDMKEIAIAAATAAGAETPKAILEFVKTVLGKNILGPASVVVGEILGDQVRFFRAKNALRLADQWSEILEQREVTSPKPIHPSLAIPLLNEATLQDDEVLQRSWATLIANAMDPNYKHPVNRTHVDKLARLTPQGAEILDIMRYGYETRRQPMHECIFSIPQIFDDAGLIEEQDDGSKVTSDKGHAAVDNLIDLGLVLPVVQDAFGDNGQSRLFQQIHPVEIVFTKIGYEFVCACSSGEL